MGNNPLMNTNKRKFHRPKRVREKIKYQRRRRGMMLLAVKGLNDLNIRTRTRYISQLKHFRNDNSLHESTSRSFKRNYRSGTRIYPAQRNLVVEDQQTSYQIRIIWDITKHHTTTWRKKERITDSTNLVGQLNQIPR